MTQSAGTKHLPIVASDDRLKKDIAGAQTHDLVFAVVGYAGSGPSTVARQLMAQLEPRGYSALHVPVAGEIKNAALEFGIPDAASPGLPDKGVARARVLQDWGDKLRESHGGAFVAGLAVRFIDRHRTSNPATGPVAFVIDALKNPEEVDALRSIYGNGFYLISVVCDIEERTKRCARKFHTKPDDAELLRYLERDVEGGSDTGQRVLRTIHLADFFIDNHGDENEVLPPELARFVDIVVGEQIIRPRRAERGMYLAWSAAHRSSCLSRQVGAAILNEAGDAIATGTNDVPRARGGLYEEPDDTEHKDDHRCFAFADPGRTGPECRNDREKQRIYDDILLALRGIPGGDPEFARPLLADDVTLEAVRKRIEKTRVKDLIEFSRAVHAEMDALLSLARTGAGGSRGATLFSTTYPCHSCARHIVAAGITDVVFLEAYPKSLASKLHGDSIVDVIGRQTLPAEDAKKVQFRVFSGVAPRRYAQLFENRRELKEKRTGALKRRPNTEGPLHQDKVFTRSFLEFEKRIAETVDNLVKERR